MGFIPHWVYQQRPFVFSINKDKYIIRFCHPLCRHCSSSIFRSIVEIEAYALHIQWLTSHAWVVTIGNSNEYWLVVSWLLLFIGLKTFLLSLPWLQGSLWKSNYQFEELSFHGGGGTLSTSFTLHMVRVGSEPVIFSFWKSWNQGYYCRILTAAYFTYKHRNVLI